MNTKEQCLEILSSQISTLWYDISRESKVFVDSPKRYKILSAVRTLATLGATLQQERTLIATHSLSFEKNLRQFRDLYSKIRVLSKNLSIPYKPLLRAHQLNTFGEEYVLSFMHNNSQPFDINMVAFCSELENVSTLNHAYLATWVDKYQRACAYHTLLIGTKGLPTPKSFRSDRQLGRYEQGASLVMKMYGSYFALYGIGVALLFSNPVGWMIAGVSLPFAIKSDDMTRNIPENSKRIAQKLKNKTKRISTQLTKLFK